jgi:hypothetical protein
MPIARKADCVGWILKLKLPKPGWGEYVYIILGGMSVSSGVGTPEEM